MNPSTKLVKPYKVIKYNAVGEYGHLPQFSVIHVEDGKEPANKNVEIVAEFEKSHIAEKVARTANEEVSRGNF